MRASTHFLLALEIYERLLQRFPDHPQMLNSVVVPLVMLGQLGDPARLTQAFSVLVTLESRGQLPPGRRELLEQLRSRLQDGP